MTYEPVDIVARLDDEAVGIVTRGRAPDVKAAGVELAATHVARWCDALVAELERLANEHEDGATDRWDVGRASGLRLAARYLRGLC